jgi:hypothetical protein
MKKEELDRMMKENPEKVLEILSDIQKVPYQLIERSFDYEYQFQTGEMPKEMFSDDEPPKRLREDAEIIPIDEYLGLYEPDKMQITIFKKGIEEAVEILKCKSSDLTYIVRLHEWSHGLVHVGLSKDDMAKVSRDNNYLNEQFRIMNHVFRSIDDRLHEHLAQLLTYQSLNTLHKEARNEESREVIRRISDTFKDLRRRQPPEYQVEDYLGVTQAQLIKSITMLRNQWLKGVFEAWDMIMKFHTKDK